MNKIIFPALLIGLFSACHTSKTKIERNLLYSDPSYWYIKEIDTNIYAEPVLFYTLYKNGDCTYNVKTKDSSERFYFGDVIVNNKWSLKNDSVISLLGYSYTCEILSKSEILLKSETETIRIIRLPE